jgi:hypothetical protein
LSETAARPAHTAPEVDLQHLGPVGHEDADAVPGREAEREQRTPDAACAAENSS